MSPENGPDSSKMRWLDGRRTGRGCAVSRVQRPRLRWSHKRGTEPASDRRAGWGVPARTENLAAVADVWRLAAEGQDAAVDEDDDDDESEMAVRRPISNPRGVLQWSSSVVGGCVGRHGGDVSMRCWNYMPGLGVSGPGRGQRTRAAKADMAVAGRQCRLRIGRFGFDLWSRSQARRLRRRSESGMSGSGS